MKILKMVCIVVITTIISLNILTPKSSAVQVQNFDQMKSSIQNFMNKGKSSNAANMSGDDMRNIIMPIANILTAVGVIVLVAATIIMGIKYMFATPEEAAKLKHQLIGLVVSGVVILGATAIWKIVYNIMNSVGL